MNLRCILLWIVLATQVPGVINPVSPEIIAAPGSDTILTCSFSASEKLNLHTLIINWQNEGTVVHSFYHGSNQLVRQGQSYKGRTHLFNDQLLSGNASLMLTNVQPNDDGEYTCDVMNEQESTTNKVMLILAVPFDKPLLSLQPTCDGINVTIKFSNGYPQPEILWRDSSGEPISDTDSTVQLEPSGRYAVSSSMYFRGNTTENITIEMKLEVIGQTFSYLLQLHPHPDCCQGSHERTSLLRHWSATVAVFVLFLITVTVLVIKWIFISMMRWITSVYECVP